MMRILIDTNILFSALLFPRSKPAKVLYYISEKHQIVLCDQNIRELRKILEKKAPRALPDADALLAELSYELVPAIYHTEKVIRDATDQPILNAALVSDVDMILTGDKDFLSLGLERPMCLSIADFLSFEALTDEMLERFR